MEHKDETAQVSTTVKVADAGLFSFLSHDIRSSFSEVSSGLDALAHTTTDPQSQKDIRQLIAANGHLGRLLCDALTMIVGEHAVQPPEFGDTDVEAFLSMLVMRWRKIVTATGVALEFDTDSSLPERLQIDVLAVERILSNLVSNAARHANGGKIVLHACYSTSKGLCITVRDNGDGFAPEQLETLFDFPPTPVGAGEPGSGYGLRIAYSLSARMGGTLHARNAEDGGAILTLNLPVSSLARASGHMSHASVKSLLKGKRALIVDDGAVHRISLRAQLETIGLIVSEADGGTEAIEALKRHDFDLLFLDIEMPIFSGIDLLRTLKTNGIPLPATIGVTAHAYARNHVVIKAAGAHSVLNKPVSNAPILYSAILRALHLLPRFPSDTNIPDATLTFDAAQQLKGLEALIKTLNPTVQKTFLSELENDLKSRLKVAQTLAARDMTQSDKQAFAHEAHALAGLFATSYHPAAHLRALHLESIVYTDTRSKVVELLNTLSQDTSDIIKTIHVLKHKN